VLNLPQTTVSRQLAVLRNAGLVEDEREGTWIKYSICVSGKSLDKQVLNLIKNFSNKDKQLRADLKSFDEKSQKCELVIFD